MLHTWRETLRKLLSPAVLLLALLLALGHLPLLADFTRQAWFCPARDLFPILLAGALLLASRPDEDAETAGRPARGTCYFLLACAWMLLAVAGLLDSPSLGVIGGLVTLAGIAAGVGGRLGLRRALPALALLSLVIPFQSDLYHRLVLNLQGLTAEWSGDVLDTLGVTHVRTGNVVEVPGQRLLVEEACSGIQSLSAVFTCTALFALWLRRPLLHALLLVASSGVWAVAMNVVRVAGGIWLTTERQAQVLEGPGHDQFGFLVFAGTLILTLSTDQLLLFFSSPRRPPVVEPEGPIPVEKGTVPLGLEEPAAAPAGVAPRRAAWAVAAVAFAGLGLAQFWLFWPETAHAAPADTPLARGLAVAQQDMLPTAWGHWRLLNFDAVHRDRGNPYGDYSWVWRYAQDDKWAVVALDYPFSGWHELSGCYLGQGWTLEQRQLRRAAAASGGVPECWAQCTFVKSLERYGYLWFGLFDEYGRPVEPRPKDYGGRLRARLAALGRGELRWHEEAGGKTTGAAPGEGPFYQVQLFIESYAPLPATEREEALEFFRLVRARFGPYAAGAEKGEAL
jgi:exosortase